MAHLYSRLEKLAHGVQKVGHPWFSRKQIPGQIFVPTIFSDENFYSFFIKKFFTFFLTLYIGLHKDNQAQLAL